MKYMILSFAVCPYTVESRSDSLDGLDFDTVKDKTAWEVVAQGRNIVTGTYVRTLAKVNIPDHPGRANEMAAFVREELLARRRVGALLKLNAFCIGNCFRPDDLYISPRWCDLTRADS